MKYKEHIINYAIENKVSLEEAYKHFIIKGRDEKEEKFKKAYMDEETKDHFEDEDYVDPERYNDLYGDQPNSDEPGATLSPEEEEAWKMYDAIKSDLERLYERVLSFTRRSHRSYRKDYRRRHGLGRISAKDDR